MAGMHANGGDEAVPRPDPLPEDTAEDLYDAAPCGYLSSYPDGTLAKVNQTFLTWTGYRREDLVGRRRFIDLLSPGGRIYHETHFAPLLRMQRAVQEIAFDLVRADGSRMPVLVNARLRTDDAGQPLLTLTTVFDASDRKKYEHELLLARKRAEQYADRLATLQQAVADLAAAADVNDVGSVIVRVAGAAVDAAASALWLYDADSGSYRWVTSQGATTPPTSARTLRPDSAASAHELLSGGTVTVVDPDGGGDLGRVWQALGGSEDGRIVLAPLVAQGQTLGVVACRVARDRSVDDEEAALLQTLGRQAGLAVARARLFDQQRAVALTLQRSMLPQDLPQDPRLGLATCYLPAEDTMEVGGDWYDMFAVGGDRVVVAVGDVVGRGVHAAAAMGQLRSAVRALAAVDPDPATLLGRLDRFVEDVPTAQMATLVYAQLDLRDGTLRYACAGHPPPVLLHPGGDAELLWGGRSTPLGSHFGSRRRSGADHTLLPGSRVLLYSDGLIERRDRGLDVGLDRLVRTVANCGRASLQAQVQDVTRALLGDVETRDDVCVLGLGYRDAPAFEHRLSASRPGVDALRTELSTWLDEHGVRGDEQEEIVIACYEAVANSIEHGYEYDDGDIDVLARIDLSERSLLMLVSDTGRWQGRSRHAGGGRGLSVMRALMDEVSIDHTAGTVVTMQRRIQPGADR